MGSCVEPGKALSEKFHIQSSLFQIDPVQIGNFQLAAGGRLQILRILYDLIVVEIESGHAVVALRMLRLLLNRNSLSVGIEFHDSEPLRSST